MHAGGRRNASRLTAVRHALLFRRELKTGNYTKQSIAP